MTDARAGVAVQVVRAFPDRADLLDLHLSAGATVAEALAAARAAGWEADGIDGVAVYGRLVDAAQVLRDGDRLELLRPLVADPKQRRRARALPPRGRQAP